MFRLFTGRLFLDDSAYQAVFPTPDNLSPKLDLYIPLASAFHPFPQSGAKGTDALFFIAGSRGEYIDPLLYGGIFALHQQQENIPFLYHEPQVTG